MSAGRVITMSSQVNVLEVVTTWKICNFTHHGKAVGEGITETFIFHDSPRCRNKWVVELFPSGDCEEDKEYVALYMRPHQDNELPCSAGLTMFILDQNEERVNINKFAEPITFEDYAPWGWSKYIKRIELLDPVNKLLPGNVLTLGCTVTMLSEDPRKIEQTEPQLARDLLKLLTNKAHADLVFVCEGEEIKAHKSILSARCPTYEAMFGQQVFDENATNRVKIVDMSAAALKEMLRFIYTDKVENLTENAEELFAAANKYDLDGLKEISTKSLSTHLTPENAARVFRLADQHNVNKLKAKAVSFIHSNMNEVMGTPGWQELKESCSKLIVEEIMERSQRRLFQE